MIATLNSHEPKLDGAEVQIWPSTNGRYCIAINLGREWDSKTLEWHQVSPRTLSVIAPGRSAFSQASFPALVSVQAWMNKTKVAFFRAAGVKRIRHGEWYHFRIPMPDECGRFVPEWISEVEYRREFPKLCAA